MARVCEICGKGRQLGYSVSHANNRRRKIWQANLQSVRVVKEGTVKRIRVCTRCLRSGKVAKVIS